jgi:hypothetical protein
MAAAAAGLPGAEWIVPAGESLRRERRLLHASLIAGGILAVGLLAYEGFSVSRELTTERAVLAERQAKVDALHAEVDARREAGVVSKNLARLERGVDEVGGEHTPWRAFFREIAGLCELHPVRMTDVSTSTVPGGTSWSLKGIVFLDQNSQVDPLSQFIESLQRSPLVAGVEVGATRRIEVEGRAAKQFSVSAQVRALHLGQGPCRPRPGGGGLQVNPTLARTYASKSVLLAAVAGAVWYFAVRPMTDELRQARAAFDSFAVEIDEHTRQFWVGALLDRDHRGRPQVEACRDREPVRAFRQPRPRVRLARRAGRPRWCPPGARRARQGRASDRQSVPRDRHQRRSLDRGDRHYVAAREFLYRHRHTARHEPRRVDPPCTRPRLAGRPVDGHDRHHPPAPSPSESASRPSKPTARPRVNQSSRPRRPGNDANQSSRRPPRARRHVIARDRCSGGAGHRQLAGPVQGHRRSNKGRARRAGLSAL